MRSWRSRAPIALEAPFEQGAPAFALQHLHDGRRIQAAHFAQKARPLEQLYVLRRVQSVFAGGTLRTSKAQAFPGANDRGRNADQARHVTDFQVRFWLRRTSSLNPHLDVDLRIVL